MQKIMFNDRYGLTEEVLDDYKTMTRRIVPKALLPNDRGSLLKMSRFKVGDEIAIAQKYSECVNDILTNWGHKTDIATLAFKELAGWDNKMFVKAELMPHRIRITDIRVERLQDIPEEDCFKEGVWEDDSRSITFGGYQITYPYYRFEEDGDLFTTPRKAFAALIDKVSGKGTWESNPYVWVYSFELMKI